MICTQVQLNDQTVLFLTIQFNGSHSFAYSLNGTLSGVITPSQSEPGSNGNKEYSAFPKAPRMESHHQIV